MSDFYGVGRAPAVWEFIHREPLTGVTVMTAQPTIEAEVTFLSPEDGGRAHQPDLSAGVYKPHLVVQPSDVRTAVIEGGFCVEPYLGVAFISGPVQPTPGQPSRVTLLLGYHPEVDYGALRDGATFTVREGGKVVGFGQVLRGYADME
jgi:translation elongation factor EF-Tu-like GTPase